MQNSIKSILLNAKNIAIVGASSNPNKDSFKVMKFFQEKGYKVIPINSKTINSTILGEKIYKKIENENFNIDILNIFRPSSEILSIVNHISNINVKTVWLQLEIFCSESEKILGHLGTNFVQNKCTKIEYENIFK